MEVLNPDATGIYVAAHQAAGAIEEAIEAEVPLIVAVAEHIPLHDMLRVCILFRRPPSSLYRAVRWNRVWIELTIKCFRFTLY